MSKESNGNREYRKAYRITEVNFPGKPICLDCPYCRHKSGLYGDPPKRYENFICVLTYEPLPRSEIGREIGTLCPLEFADNIETEE
ncbi:MAG: hypothetical protein ACOX7J_06455 [Bacillota bacterium]|jgi:hypothetical protein